ncbi:glycosyltransferase family 2 protein [Actinomyces bowdenii]|nr:glycosyltransferase [Actinomyces bowdenii]MBO3724576.1 glycosyltransferase family 2 protein [Actinomyces bowdenii]
MSAVDSIGGVDRVGALAVVVTAGATPFLAPALRAVATQSRVPDIVLIVDVASRANGLGDGTPIEEIVESCGLDDVSPVRIVRSGEAATFGDAVARGLESYSRLIASGNRRRSGAADRRKHAAPGQITGPTGAMSPITVHECELVSEIVEGQESPGQQLWLWLLHDDCAPEPGCLEALMSTATNARSVGIVGPKQVSWDRPDHLLEVGLRATASARRANDIVPGEVDQGQYDDRSDVLAVGTAGALIDRAVWDELGGTAPWLGPFGDGLELSRAARLAGYRVVVEPGAVIRHRRASYLGLRRAPGAEGGEQAAPVTALPEQDPERSYRARRIAQLTNWAAFSNRPLPLLLAWFLILGLVRFVWRMVLKAPSLARDELAAAVAVAGRGGLIRAGRRRLARHSEVPRSALGRLYVEPAQIRAYRRDRVRQDRERRAREKAPSELELRELAALARARRRTLGAVTLVALMVAGAGLSHVVLTRSIVGGALTGLDMTWSQAWSAAWSGWLPTSDGYAGGPAPLLAILALPLALAGALGLGGATVIQVLLLTAIPLAALGAWFAAGALSRRVALRAGAALAWALTPTGLLAVGQGRLAAVLVHLALPWALLALARAVGADRRDVVVSGMVGAHQLTDEERAELDRFSQGRLEDLAHLDEEAAGTDPAEPGAGEEPAPTPAGTAGAEAGQAGSLDAEQASAGRDEEAVSAPGTREGSRSGVPEPGAARAEGMAAHGPGSATAAAAAGLLLSIVVAAAPATAVILLALLVILTILTRGGRRLVLTILPLVATAAPAWWRAWQLGRDAGWGEGLRLLLTDLGAPLAVSAPSSTDLLLGSPIDLDVLLPVSWLAVLARILLVLVPLAGLIGLLIPGAAGARSRTGILLALGGLALAALSIRVVTAVGTTVQDPSVVLVTGWAGTGLSLSLAGFLIAALAAGDAAVAALRPRRAAQRRTVLAVAGALALAGPILIGAAWSWQSLSAPGTQLMALRPGSQQVPIIAAQAQASPTAGRVLLLASTPQGLRASVWRGPGLQITDALPSVLNTELRQRAGTSLDRLLLSPAAPGARPLDLQDRADAAMAQLVARATSGQDEGVAQALADHGIAVILLRNAAGDEVTADARSAMASTPGLEQLAQTESGTAWRVAPDGEQSAARLRVIETGAAPAGSGSPAASTALPWSGGASGTTVQLPEGRGERLLVLAERRSHDWSATLNGRPLSATTVPHPEGGWAMAFSLPASGGELTVTHASTVAVLLSRAIWVVWALTLIAALPLRRGKESA